MSNPHEDTNALLIRRALVGDHAAFTQLAERYRPMVFALCLQWAQNAADADDLTQETLLKAFACLGQIREPDRFGPWLARTAINMCKNWRARGHHDLLPLTAAHQPLHSDRTEEELTQSIVLRDALATLPPELGLVIRWFYLDGLSQQDIAVLWRVPQSTVKGRLDAGRLRLRKEYQKMGLLPEEAVEAAVAVSRIALTDANAEDTRILRAAFKEAGFTCSVIKPEELILPRLRRFRPDILVLHSPFGDVDEFNLLQAIRVDLRLRGTSVMFLTPRNDEPSIYRAWNLGVDAYLTIPWNVKEVVHFVGRIDKARRARDYVGLAIEFAWRKQTETALRCLDKALGVMDLSVWCDESVARTIRTEAAFNYLRSTSEFAAILARLPVEEELKQPLPDMAAMAEADAKETGH